MIHNITNRFSAKLRIYPWKYGEFITRKNDNHRAQVVATIIFKSTILPESSNNNNLVKGDQNGHKYNINNDLTIIIYNISFSVR